MLFQNFKNCQSRTNFCLLLQLAGEHLLDPLKVYLSDLLHKKLCCNEILSDSCVHCHFLLHCLKQQKMMTNWIRYKLLDCFRPQHSFFTFSFSRGRHPAYSDSHIQSDRWHPRLLYLPWRYARASGPTVSRGMFPDSEINLIFRQRFL